MERIFVGTCGYAYSWNPDGLDWYLSESGFNTLELDSSFYHFPRESSVKKWIEATEKHPIPWAIKVHKSITHLYKFDNTAIDNFEKFMKIFKPMDKFIEFYLFQLPPSTKDLGKVEAFFKKTERSKFALEVRNLALFTEETVNLAQDLGITLVSVDAPVFPREIYSTNGKVYLRIHGRVGWYSYNYSESELKEIADKVKRAKAKEKYVFFNNTFMYENGKKFMQIYSKI
jgi:uncharacterized protein YecE (DUF72 family)